MSELREGAGFGSSPVFSEVDAATSAERGTEGDKLQSEPRGKNLHQHVESLVGGRFSIEEGRAEFLDDHTIAVGGKRLTGEKILIASGSRPVVPAIEGLDDVPYLTSDLLTNGEPMIL